MPSNAFSAELRPDPQLRRIVLGSGIGLLLTGLVVIATLPLPMPHILTAVAIWTAVSVVQLRLLVRSWRACALLRVLPGGEVAVRGPDGTWSRGALAPGGILLREWGWIRYRTASGRVAAEFLRGCSRRSPDWRRLQVLWRHVGAPASSC